MKYIILFVISLSACAFQPYEENEPPKFLNYTSVSEDTLNQVIDFTNTVALDGKPVNLNGYIISVFPDIDTTTRECEYKKEGSHLLGCAQTDYKIINTTWLFNDPTWDAAYEAESALVLAHEMGHVYYDQYENDPDADHKHSEWFYDKEGVCGVVEQHFYDLFKAR